MMLTPLVSIVVPTRNRSDSVRRLLSALSMQTSVERGFEVIVAADGCTDSTVRHVTAMRCPFEVHAIELPPSGPSLARNCGASLARGETLIFLDDDVEPVPGFVAAHASFHASHARAIALGYLPPVVGGGFFGATLRNWWEGMFDGPRSVSHRYSYRDLLSGNFSIARADFEELGGFDSELRCHEDWELGYRAIRSGFELRFVPGAVACHYDATDIPRSFRRKFDEGVADVQLARKHPELIPVLPLGRLPVKKMLRSRAARLAWNNPQTGERFVASARWLLEFYERWNLRFRWRALLEAMLAYWYWRGVASTLATPADLDGLLARATAPESPELEIDLAGGIEPAARLIDARRPRSVHVVHGARVIGDIPDVAGSEPLRAVHLRRAVARDLADAFASAMAHGRLAPPLFVSPVA